MRGMHRGSAVDRVTNGTGRRTILLAAVAAVIAAVGIVALPTVASAVTSLTVTADDAVSQYGSALPALTISYTGFVNGDTSASLTTQPTCSTPATAASPAGSYPITCSGAVDPNYSLHYVAGTLTITTAPLTVTADDQHTVYGDPLPVLTVSYTGFTNGDTSQSLAMPPTCTTPATSASPARSYAITCSGVVDQNYAIQSVPGTLTIAPAPLTITADDQSGPTGGPLPTLTVSYTGFTNGDTSQSLTATPTCVTTATSSSPAGPYPITCSGAMDNNYSIAYVSGTLTLAQAPPTLTITADAEAGSYGGPLPTLAATYSGFTGGDTAASLTTTPTCATTATSASPAGNYPITCGGAVDPKYTIVYVPGTLDIARASLTVTADDQSANYGGTLPGLTVSFAGFTNGDTSQSLVDLPSCSTPAADASPAGTYPITCTGAVDSNYTITTVPGTMTIHRVPLTVVADDQSTTFADALPALTVTYLGFTNGDTSQSLVDAATCTTTATQSSLPGQYPITCAGAVDSNYSITYQSGTLTVEPSGLPTLTVTADDGSTTVGNPLPPLTASYSGFINGDTSASLTTVPTCTTTATPSDPAGQYPVTCSGAADPDYSIIYVPGTLIVRDRPVPPAPTDTGYWLVAGDGGVFAFGGAPFEGSLGGASLDAPIVGMAATPSGHGYWLVASDGGVFAFGDATFAGSLGGVALNAPIVGMAATPSGHGYWLVASDGGVFAFGDATFAGSLGGVALNAPIVGMAGSGDGQGYRLVGADGGVFAFGDAPYEGSHGAVALDAPVVGMADTATGGGYWLVAADGGVFAYGDAAFEGSRAGAPHDPVVGMAATASGAGYRLVGRDGAVLTFGDAGTALVGSPTMAVVGIAGARAAPAPV